MKLRLADNLALPLDAVTRTFGILAVRGAGKSNTAAVMAEEMFGAGLPFVVIDPVSAWWGLRSSGDGGAPGLALPIFGGKHGDIPLERGAGELLADLIVEKRLSCVLDLSRFDSEGDKKAFLLAFARRLYQRNENPLHLFLEEADDYIPQHPMRDEAQLLRAWENIVRRGRGRGLGITLITQRSAALNKMVLTQVETLITMRTTGPQDQKAIEAWIQYHAQSRDVMASLSGLEDGEAWVWSPHFLKAMVRVQIRRRRTFDSGATPTNVKAKDARPPATLADVDLAALQQKMAATIERAKAEDPRELRRRIAELERELKAAKQTTPPPAKVERIEVPVILPEQLRAVGEAVRAVEEQGRQVRAQIIEGFNQAVERIVQATAPILVAMGQVKVAHQAGMRIPQDAPLPRRGPGNRVIPPAVTRRPVPRAGAAPCADAAAADLGKCERAVLAVLAQHPEGCRKGKLALLAGYRYSGGFRNALSALRTQGLIVGGNEEMMSVADAGLEVLGPYDPLPTGRALVAYWLQHPTLGKAERAILEVLFDRMPHGLTGPELAEATGYEFSGGFRNALSTLRTAGLVVGRNHDRMTVAEELTG